jgi:putative membrane protein insertion efficiency factor
MEVLRIKNNPVANKLSAPENKLVRPVLNYRDIIAKIVITATLIIVMSAITHYVVFCKIGFIVLRDHAFMVNILICVFWMALALINYSNHIVITLIRIYQCHASSETRLKCCFMPSCSEYGIIAIKKYGTIKGIIKTIGRLRRCEYPGGIDYP